jgi:hypothetical protein
LPIFRLFLHFLLWSLPAAIRSLESSVSVGKTPFSLIA